MSIWSVLQKVTSRKTKWPRFWPVSYPVLQSDPFRVPTRPISNSELAPAVWLSVTGYAHFPLQTHITHILEADKSE